MGIYSRSTREVAVLHHDDLTRYDNKTAAVAVAYATGVGHAPYRVWRCVTCDHWHAGAWTEYAHVPERDQALDRAAGRRRAALRRHLLAMTMPRPDRTQGSQRCCPVIPASSSGAGGDDWATPDGPQALVAEPVT